MEIELRTLDDILAATVTGVIDGRTSPLLEERLVPEIRPNAKILLDMSGVTYMSSAGLRVLLLLYRQVDARGGRVVLTGLSDMLHDTMAITGFLDFFVALPTVDAGLLALGADGV